MTFTDEDLMQFKNAIENQVYVVPLKTSKALLERLEAAEKALEDADGAIYSVYDPDRNDCPLCDNFMGPCKEYCDFPKFHKSLETWRKSKGE